VLLFSSNSFPFRQAVDLYRGGVSCQCSFTQQVLIEHRELRDEKGNRCLPANEGGCGHFVSEHSVGSFDVFLPFPLLSAFSSFFKGKGRTVRGDKHRLSGYPIVSSFCCPNVFHLLCFFLLILFICLLI